MILFLVLLIVVAPTSMTIDAEQTNNDDGAITIWSTNQTVEEDYIIEFGETLIIKPGVVVRLNQSVRLVVNGTLRVEGDENDMVLPTYNKTTKSDINGYWKGIEFNAGSEGIIRNSTMEFAWSAIEIESASPMIRGNVIRFAQAHAIFFEGPSNPIISNNNIIDNNNGIFCHGDSMAIIENNNISNNSVGIMTGSSITISNNRFIANKVAAIYCAQQSSPIITDCIILNTSVNDFEIVSNSHPKVFNSVFDEKKVYFGDESTLTVDGKILRKKQKTDDEEILSMEIIAILLSIIISIIIIFGGIISCKCPKELDISTEVEKIKAVYRIIPYLSLFPFLFGFAILISMLILGHPKGTQIGIAIGTPFVIMTLIILICTKIRQFRLKMKVWIPKNYLKCGNAVFIITIGLNIFIGIGIAIVYFLRPEQLWNLIQNIIPLSVFVLSLSLLTLIIAVVMRKRRILFHKSFSEGHKNILETIDKVLRNKSIEFIKTEKRNLYFKKVTVVYIEKVMIEIERSFQCVEISIYPVTEENEEFVGSLCRAIDNALSHSD